jgi:hypothetical protein
LVCAHACDTKPALVNGITLVLESGMNDLIASTEFGDWLMGECKQESEVLLHVNADASAAACQRLESLSITKAILLEFLMLKQEMLKKAARARSLSSVCTSSSRNSGK